MAAAAITKPELALANMLAYMDTNPAAPYNIKSDPTVIYRLMANDFKSAFSILTPAEYAMLAGKAKPTLTSVNSGINKPRKRYRYRKPWCEDAPQDCTTAICDVTGTTTEPYGYLELAIDQCGSDFFKINASEFENLQDQDVQMRTAQELERIAYNLIVAANKKAIELLYLASSDYVDGTDAFTAPKALTLISSDMKILPVAKTNIDAEYRKSRFRGRWENFGGETVARYYDVANLQMNIDGSIGIGNSMQRAALPFIYDLDFDTVIQGIAEDSLSHLLTVPIGSVWLDTWTDNRGDKEVRMDHRLSTTRNIMGFDFDIDYKFDDCTKDHLWMLKLQWGFGSIPDSIYCDPARGLIRHWTTQCGEANCEVLF